MTVQKGSTRDSRRRGQNPSHQGTAETPVFKARELSAPAPRLKSCPPAWSLGRSAPTHCTITRPFSSPAQPGPGEKTETAAAPHDPFLQEQYQNYLRTMEPYPLTLTQRPKVTEEAPTLRRRGKTKESKERPFPPPQKIPDSRWALHPLPSHAPSPWPVQTGRREYVDRGPALGGE